MILTNSPVVNVVNLIYFASGLPKLDLVNIFGKIEEVLVDKASRNINIIPVVASWVFARILLSASNFHEINQDDHEAHKNARERESWNAGSQVQTTEIYISVVCTCEPAFHDSRSRAFLCAS
jgi:hypothetical protein